MAHQQSFSPEIAAPSVGTKAEPLVAGNGGNGGSGGIAAVETDVGDVECLLYPRSRAQRGQTKLSENTDDATTRANPARGRPKAQSARGGRASTPGNCPSGKAATARARQPDDDGVKSGGDVGEDDGDNIGDRGGVDRSTTTAPKRLSTERSQQMYDVYRQTQVFKAFVDKRIASITQEEEHVDCDGDTVPLQKWRTMMSSDPSWAE